MLLNMNKILLFLFLICSTVEATPITAKSFLVTDNKGAVILEKNADRTQSIASITKLMTAIIVLNAHQDLRYVFRRFYAQSPGIIQVYQNFRFYADEHDGCIKAQKEFDDVC
jgi:uncharacterized lipoprotein YajG